MRARERNQTKKNKNKQTKLNTNNNNKTITTNTVNSRLVILRYRTCCPHLGQVLVSPRPHPSAWWSEIELLRMEGRKDDRQIDVENAIGFISLSSRGRLPQQSAPAKAPNNPKNKGGNKGESRETTQEGRVQSLLLDRWNEEAVDKKKRANHFYCCHKRPIGNDFLARLKF
jgi:hypothetical protein